MGAADLCCPGNVISEPFAVPLNSREFPYLLFWGPHSRTIIHVLFGRCFGPFLSQAPEASAGSTASVRPTQEEQSTTPPGKVVTISSRSPRCPRNQSALRNGKTFSPNSAACSSGGAQGGRAGRLAGQLGLCESGGHRVPEAWPRSSDHSPVHGVKVQKPPPPHVEGEHRPCHKGFGVLGRRSRQEEGTLPVGSHWRIFLCEVSRILHNTLSQGLKA